MFSPTVARLVLLLVCMAEAANAEGFLKSKQVAKEEVRQFLLSELAGHDSGRLDWITEQLRPMYAALPKNAELRLEPVTVRYALHRYFVQKHGWFVTGLDGGAAWNSSKADGVLKARAPSYIQSLFEEQMHGQGLGLHELAAFAATLEDLIHAEAVGQLEWIFAALRLPLVGPLLQEAAADALEYFGVAFLYGNNAVAEDIAGLEGLKYQLMQQYPEYNATAMWAQDLREAYNLDQLSRRNPFVPRHADFRDLRGFALEIGHRFGSFQNLECHALKRKLVDLEHAGTGRVLLSSFYSNALAGSWEFMESAAYLRNQGALDETNPDRPSVVIPNYINARANCLMGSEFYSVCCMNECEGLMRQLEETIALPSAPPARVAEVVSQLHSDTVDAPRNLSAALHARLDEIGRHHGGRVPLHGRLFAQWMHHAYPRECNFPRSNGSAEALSPEEWAEKHGAEFIEVSVDDMHRHAARKDEFSEAPADLPWTFEEELIAEDRRWATQHRVRNMLTSLVLLAALVSFAMSLLHSGKSLAVGARAAKSESLMV